MLSSNQGRSGRRMLEPKKANTRRYKNRTYCVGANTQPDIPYKSMSVFCAENFVTYVQVRRLARQYKVQMIRIKSRYYVRKSSPDINLDD